MQWLLTAGPGWSRQKGLRLLYSPIYFAMQSELAWRGQGMHDLDKALADIVAIRSQLAAGTAFRGYGPAAMAATGGVALATAVLQFVWLDDPTGYPLTFLFGWAAAAVLSSL